MGPIISERPSEHLLLKSGWQKVALAVVVFPITIFMNAVRIVGLSLLSIHVDPGFMTGNLHHRGGVVFFLVAMLLLGCVLSALRRSEAPPD
ncbi:MAG TPA: archaeosortase/exosortase family protein [Candidatus Deferrimicrobiaceae bacterium]|jgi:exosortase/archaeosortase family protein